MTAATKHRLRVTAAVGPLVLIIVASLIWSAYATYHYVLSDKVPAGVAWTLVAALDGTVVVTTPIWLSTILPGKVRNYSAVICVLALLGSMGLNYAETGWPGVLPPFIAGSLIHLVGVVLRAFASLNKDVPPNPETDVAPAGEEHGMPTLSPEKAEPEQSVEDTAPAQPTPQALVDTEGSPAVVVVPAPAPPVSEEPAYSLPPAGLPPQEIVFWILNEAYVRDDELPSGPQLTSAVRAAGHTVNDEYGRTTKARWRAARARQSEVSS